MLKSRRTYLFNHRMEATCIGVKVSERGSTAYLAGLRFPWRGWAWPLLLRVGPLLGRSSRSHHQ